MKAITRSIIILSVWFFSSCSTTPEKESPEEATPQVDSIYRGTPDQTD
jgi:hypothetical protein